MPQRRPLHALAARILSLTHSLSHSNAQIMLPITVVVIVIVIGNMKTDYTH